MTALTPLVMAVLCQVPAATSPWQGHLAAEVSMARARADARYAGQIDFDTLRGGADLFGGYGRLVTPQLFLAAGVELALSNQWVSGVNAGARFEGGLALRGGWMRAGEGGRFDRVLVYGQLTPLVAFQALASQPREVGVRLGWGVTAPSWTLYNVNGALEDSTGRSGSKEALLNCLFSPFRLVLGFLNHFQLTLEWSGPSVSHGRWGWGIQVGSGW